jgi:hypothetical protein
LQDRGWGGRGGGLDGCGGAVELDGAGEAVRGAFDQDVKEVGEEERAQKGEKPGEEVTEIGEVQPGVKIEALSMNEVEGITPGAGSDQVFVGRVAASVLDFLFDPEISEQAEGDHGQGVRDFGFEVQHLGRPTSEPGGKTPEPNADGGIEGGESCGLFGKKSAEEPDGEENGGGTERAKRMPIGGVRMGEGDGDTGEEGSGEERRPAGETAKDAQERISGVVNFLAEKAPERRLPKNGVLTPKVQLSAGQAVNTKSAGDGNENAGVTAEVVAGDGKVAVSAKREVDAETGDDEENDDGGSAENDGVPTVREKAAEGSGGVNASEEGEQSVVANGDPESQDEAESVEDRVTGVLIGVRGLGRGSGEGHAVISPP